MRRVVGILCFAILLIAGGAPAQPGGPDITVDASPEFDAAVPGDTLRYVIRINVCITCEITIAGITIGTGIIKLESAKVQ